MGHRVIAIVVRRQAPKAATGPLIGGRSPDLHGRHWRRVAWRSGRLAATIRRWRGVSITVPDLSVRRKVRTVRAGAGSARHQLIFTVT